MSIIRWMSAGILSGAVALTGLAVAGPAQAAPVPSTTLEIGFAYGEEGTPVDHTVTLTCRPPGGSHPAPAQACKTLRTFGTDLATLDVNPGICTFEYYPVTVTLQGRWEGKELAFQTRTFGNPCAAQRALGAVFPI